MPETRQAPGSGGVGARSLQPRTPHSIEIEHEELMEDLAHLVGAPGETGAAARTVAEILRPHFEKERALALPPLGILRSLAQGYADGEAQETRALVRDLRRELPAMLEEHQRIGRAVEHLADVAKRTGSADGRAFAEKLRLHAEMEEEILYPAALLIGRFLEEHTDRPPSPSGRR